MTTTLHTVAIQSRIIPWQPPRKCFELWAVVAGGADEASRLVMYVVINQYTVFDYCRTNFSWKGVNLCQIRLKTPKIHTLAC